jgi:uncharacterized protein (TIGR04141 family)
VWAYNDEDEPVDKRYDLYDYVQAEVLRADGRYVLTAGVWFRVSDDYVAQIRAYVGGIDDVTNALALPAWNTAALRADANDKTRSRAVTTATLRLIVDSPSSTKTTCPSGGLIRK